MNHSSPYIWIDLDNAPHAHLFAPLVRALPERGYTPLVSVRSFGQTEALARQYEMKFTSIGNHATGMSKTGRVLETLQRAAQLIEFGAAHRPVAAVSHGSRALTIAAAALGIPSMALYDYEHVAAGVFHRLCQCVLVPEVVLREAHGPRRATGYPGFKEDVYLHDFRPDAHICEKLGLDAGRLIVVVRPPATWAHYHRAHSTTLFSALVERLAMEREAQVMVLARTFAQAAALARDYRLDRPPFRLTAEAVDGLSLMACADAVFSGGGTMVREAALLGADAYSSFAGKAGAVDLELERLGWLTVLRSTSDIERVRLAKRGASAPRRDSRVTREFILQRILELAGKGH